MFQDSGKIKNRHTVYVYMSADCEYNYDDTSTHDLCLMSGDGPLLNDHELHFFSNKHTFVLIVCNCHFGASYVSSWKRKFNLVPSLDKCY